MDQLIDDKTLAFLLHFTLPAPTKQAKLLDGTAVLMDAANTMCAKPDSPD